jgi:pimeloyl-ACP methyl ester carboxylesterase
MSLFIEATAAMPPWSGPGRLGQHQADMDYQDRLTALAGIRVPCLVIAFELDLCTSAALCAEVASAIPDCRYVEIAGAGHGGTFEKPDEINAVLLEFFAGH